jgi:predicted phage baseplate assembly protein
LFGRGAMVSVGLLPPLTARPGSVPTATDPGAAVAALLAQQETLLDRKLRRLRTLARRARDGLVLGAEVTAEITASWGPAFAAGLDPADPALFGPAVGALGQDPRAALPAATVRLAGPGAEPLPAGAASVPWTPRRTLLASSGQDRHFVGEADDDGVLHLRFGDGTYGEPPEPGASLAACYRTGNGTAGNVPAEAITALVSCTTRFGDIIAGVRNPLAAQGGTDAEPSADAQLYAPAEIGQPLRRAVTADDYAAVAAADPGLQRAAAELRWTGSWYEAHVALDPAGTETLEKSLVRTVTRDLRRVRRLGHDLRVGPAEYVPLEIVMQVCVLPGYQRAHVEAALLDVFGTGTAASGQPGFFSPDNLTFGTPVSVSKLVAAAASVTGVQSAQVTTLQRLGQGDDGELAAGVLTTGPLQIPQLDNDPRHPEHGVLQLVMGGGR